MLQAGGKPAITSRKPSLPSNLAAAISNSNQTVQAQHAAASQVIIFLINGTFDGWNKVTGDITVIKIRLLLHQYFQTLLELNPFLTGG